MTPELELIIKIALPLLTLVVGIPLLVSRIRTSSITYQSINLEHFEKLRELCGNDARANLAQLKVGFGSIIKGHLTPKEVEWFLYIPNAYSYLKKYDGCSRFLEIDTYNHKFIWRDKYSTKFSRISMKLILFLLYMVLVTVGVYIFIALDNLFSLFGLALSILFVGVGIIFIFLGAIALLFNLKMGDAKELTKKVVVDKEELEYLNSA